MNAENFVAALRAVALEAAAVDVIATLKRPPGRRPSAEIAGLSAWFNSLSDADREMVRRIAELTSRYAVFGVLAVLDGARQIQGAAPAPKGHLELRYVEGEDEEILSGPRGAVLHELL